MISDRAFLLSEVKTLEYLLSRIPKREVIDRMSLESRLVSVKEELAALPPEELLPKKVTLSFCGKPVAGTRAIKADFTSKALGAFLGAFTAIAKSLANGIQHQACDRLLITGTTVGFVGFEFELPRSNDEARASMSSATDKALQAMEKLETVLRMAGEGSDEELAAIVQDVEPFAMGKIREFLDLLVQQEAWCHLQFQDRGFCFPNLEQLKTAWRRVGAGNI